jgi:hypothetical protein
MQVLVFVNYGIIYLLLHVRNATFATQALTKSPLHLVTRSKLNGFKRSSIAANIYFSFLVRVCSLQSETGSRQRFFSPNVKHHRQYTYSI